MTFEQHNRMLLHLAQDSANCRGLEKHSFTLQLCQEELVEPGHSPDQNRAGGAQLHSHGNPT